MDDIQRARSRLVVKNTFIDVVDDRLGEHEDCFRGLRARASSDPSLFETSQQEARRQAFDRAVDEAKEGDVDFDLTGMSDSDTKTEDEGVAALPCYSHIAEERAGEQGSASAGAGSSVVDSPAVSEDAAAPWTSGPSTSQGEIERLISENARLALENKLLRNQYMGPVVASCAAARQEQVPAAAPETVWVPVGFVMPAQAHCQARAAPDVRAAQGSEAPEQPQPSRRQRRRGAAQRAAAAAAAAGAATCEHGCVAAEAAGEQRTTVMLRNLPNNYTRAMVLALLDSEGFVGKYDFLYLPIDFKSRACLGYAFINLVDPADVLLFWNRFDGYSKWILPSKKVCHVSWSGPHQGLESHIERYRNSPVMHKSVPDEYKPVVFRDGVRIVFPSPTKMPRAPRIRHMSEFRATVTVPLPG